MCRIQINVARQAGKKIDYLKQQKEDRQVKNAPLKPYNWQEIILRSKMLTQKVNERPRTYLGHLNTKSNATPQLNPN